MQKIFNAIINLINNLFNAFNAGEGAVNVLSIIQDEINKFLDELAL